jgi:hypothetical protein
MRDEILDRHARARRFAIGLDRYARALRGWHATTRARPRSLRGFEIAEPRLDLTLDHGGIEIADRDHRHQIWAIPIFVIAHERVDRRFVDDLGKADRDAIRVARALEQDLRVLVEQPHAGAAAESPFFFDDAALLRDLLRIVRDVAGPVAQDVESLCDEVGFVTRHLELIHGLVPRRVRVEIGAEAHADAFEVFDECRLGEPLGAVEGHVLVEVSEAALIVVLLHRACVDCEPEQRALLGLAVLEHVVGEPVGQLALLDRGPQRERCVVGTRGRHALRRRWCHRRGR